MEVIETIVIQSTEVEAKETVVSSLDTDKSKAGWYSQSEVKHVSLGHRMMRGGRMSKQCSVVRNYINLKYIIW